MPNLVLELRSGESMLVNGASIRFRSKTRIELTAHARFLFGKQLMAAEDATSPSRRVYHALQTAYVGEPDKRDAALREAGEIIGSIRAPSARTTLDEALGHAEAGEGYRALRLVRRVIRDEEAALSAA